MGMRASQAGITLSDAARHLLLWLCDLVRRMLLSAGVVTLGGLAILFACLLPEPSRDRCMAPMPLWPLEAADRTYFVPFDRQATHFLEVRGGSGEVACEVVDGRLPPGLALRWQPGSVWFEGTVRGWGWYTARVRITDTGCVPCASRTVTVRFRAGA